MLTFSHILLTSDATNILLSHYLRTNIESCTEQWKDLKLAMKAKTTSDPDEAQRILSQTYYKKNLGSDLKQSPTAGVIWDLKERPGWDEVVE